MSAGGRARRRSAWDAAAGHWDVLQGHGGDAAHVEVLFPWIERRLGPPRGRRILDLGCGNGTLCRRLAGRGAGMVGVDSSAEMLVHARAHAETEPGSIRYLLHDLELRPLDRVGRFDALVWLCSLQDMRDAEAALRGSAAAAGPAASVLVVVESEGYLGAVDAHRATRRRWARARDRRGEPSQWIDWGRGHVTRTWVRSLDRYRLALEAAGFVVEAMEGIGADPRAAFPGPRFVGLEARAPR